jgi:hypothetical protein
LLQRYHQRQKVLKNYFSFSHEPTSEKVSAEKS